MDSADMSGLRPLPQKAPPLPTSPRTRREEPAASLPPRAGEGARRAEGGSFGSAQSEPSTLRWFCVQTKPRGESTALEHLTRQGFHCFLPRARLLRLRQGRRVRVIEPLFPRYLFLQAQPEVESLAPVRSTKGVLGLVRFGERIADVPAALVERLMRDVNAQGLIEFAAGMPRPGDRVRVLEGPLLGLEAIYRSQRGDDRAVILLTMLGRDQILSVPANTLERLAATA